MIVKHNGSFNICKRGEQCNIKEEPNGPDWIQFENFQASKYKEKRRKDEGSDEGDISVGFNDLKILPVRVQGADEHFPRLPLIAGQESQVKLIVGMKRDPEGEFCLLDRSFRLLGFAFVPSLPTAGLHGTKSSL